MTLESVLTLMLATALLTIKPGPLMLAIISRSLSDGFLPAYMMAIANVIVQMIYFCIAASSYSFAENEMLFLAFLMKSLGATYLLYVGVKGFIHLERGLWGGKADEQTKISLFDNFLAGFAITLANPFIILFYSGIIPTILPLEQIQISNIIIAGAIIAGTNLTLLTLECSLASKVRSGLKNPKIVRGINIATSTAFILIGLFIALTMFPLFDFNINF